MRRAIPLLLLTAACAGGGNPKTMNDDKPATWSGPAVRATFLAAGELSVSLTAPTGGCALELLDVAGKASNADVRLVYRTPGDRMVTQVLTPLQVVVPAAKLGGATRVSVWLSMADGKAAPGSAALATIVTR